MLVDETDLRQAKALAELKRYIYSGSPLYIYIPFSFAASVFICCNSSLVVLRSVHD
jgi:hypothetical protein